MLPYIFAHYVLTGQISSFLQSLTAEGRVFRILKEDYGEDGVHLKCMMANIEMQLGKTFAEVWEDVSSKDLRDALFMYEESANRVCGLRILMSSGAGFIFQIFLVIGVISVFIVAFCIYVGWNRKKAKLNRRKKKLRNLV